MQELENKVAEKQKEVEKLTEEIREANLLSLSLIPAEEGKFISEGNFFQIICSISTYTYIYMYIIPVIHLVNYF